MKTCHHLDKSEHRSGEKPRSAIGIATEEMKIQQNTRNRTIHLFEVRHRNNTTNIQMRRDVESSTIENFTKHRDGDGQKRYIEREKNCETLSLRSIEQISCRNVGDCCHSVLPRIQTIQVCMCEHECTRIDNNGTNNGNRNRFNHNNCMSFNCSLLSAFFIYKIYIRWYADIPLIIVDSFFSIIQQRVVGLANVITMRMVQSLAAALFHCSVCRQVCCCWLRLFIFSAIFYATFRFIRKKITFLELLFVCCVATMSGIEQKQIFTILLASSFTTILLQILSPNMVAIQIITTTTT